MVMVLEVSTMESSDGVFQVKLELALLKVRMSLSVGVFETSKSISRIVLFVISPVSMAVPKLVVRTVPDITRPSPAKSVMLSPEMKRALVMPRVVVVAFVVVEFPVMVRPPTTVEDAVEM